MAAESQPEVTNENFMTKMQAFGVFGAEGVQARFHALFADKVIANLKKTEVVNLLHANGFEVGTLTSAIDLALKLTDPSWKGFADEKPFESKVEEKKRGKGGDRKHNFQIDDDGVVQFMATVDFANWDPPPGFFTESIGILGKDERDRLCELILTEMVALGGPYIEGEAKKNISKALSMRISPDQVKAPPPEPTEGEVTTKPQKSKREAKTLTREEVVWAETLYRRRSAAQQKPFRPACRPNSCRG